MPRLFPRKKSFDPRDLPDLRGKVILVTGANTGIGYETVKHLVRKGAKVYLGARNEERAKDAIAKLQSEGLGDAGGEVVWLQMDFSDLRSTKISAEKFLKLEQRLDILINNAAQMTGPFEMTPDGISLIMTVNHFGPFVLTRTLLPLMIKTAEKPDSDVRIVMLSSWAHNITRAKEPDVQFRGIADFNSSFEDRRLSESSRYSLTKLANLLFSRELQKRLNTDEHQPHGRAITCIAVNPGTVNTSFASNLPFPRFASMICKLILTSPEVGAYNSCFCAASLEVRSDKEKWKGAYVDPVGVISEPGRNGRRDDLAKDLWNATEKILNDLNI